jgi:transcriptional regulator with XRE-family HTH domain
MKKISEILRGLREKKEMSAEQVARMCQISAQEYMWFENAAPAPNKPTKEQLEKLSDVFNIPFHVLYFLSIEEEDVPPSKRDAFKKIQPNIYKLIEQIFLT